MLASALWSRQTVAIIHATFSNGFFVNENTLILIKFSLFIPRGPINNILSLVHIMTWLETYPTLAHDGILQGDDKDWPFLGNDPIPPKAWYPLPWDNRLWWIYIYIYIYIKITTIQCDCMDHSVLGMVRSFSWHQQSYESTFHSIFNTHRRWASLGIIY